MKINKLIYKWRFVTVFYKKLIKYNVQMIEHYSELKRAWNIDKQ